MLQRLFVTDSSIVSLILRVSLGVVMFPHGAQKAFGWFGGMGLAGTMSVFTEKVGIPAPLAFLAIVIETLGALALILGLLTRPSALGMLAVMIGALITIPPHGFFMNWTGQNPGEGFEYHLLIIGTSLALMVGGGGRASIDGWLANRLGAKQTRPQEAGVAPSV